MSVYQGDVPVFSGRSTAQGFKQIAVLWSPVGPNVFNQVQKGINAALYNTVFTQARYNVLPGSPEKMNTDKSIFFQRILQIPAIVGLIVAFDDIAENEADRLVGAGKKLVFIERAAPERRRGFVCLDHKSGAAAVAQALLEMKRSRVAYIGPVEQEGWAGRTRHDTIAAALAAAGVTLESEVVSGYDMDEAVGATRRLVGRMPDLDALIFASDIQAIGGMRVLKEKGISIPDKVAVIGFDDTETARNTMPKLSSVWQPFEEVGHRAAEMMVKALTMGDEALENIYFAEKFFVRGSCLAGLSSEIEYKPGVIGATRKG